MCINCVMYCIINIICHQTCWKTIIWIKFGSYPLQPLSNWRGPNPCRCNGSSSKSSTKLLAMYTWICRQNPRFSEVVWVVSVALSQAAETYRVVSQTRRFTMVATYDQRMGRQVPCTTSSLFIGKQTTQYFQSPIRWFSIFSSETSIKLQENSHCHVWLPEGTLKKNTFRQPMIQRH